MNRLLLYILIVAINLSGSLFAQQDNWDDQFFIGNKVTWGGNSWRYSSELQSRFINNAQELDLWMLEGVATYMYSKNWEVVPDLRLSVTPDGVEYRPGIGVVRKDILGKGDNRKHQLVHQCKYQTDFTPVTINHGLRYIAFYNTVLSNNFLTTVLGGVFYSWKDHFTGLEYIRGGVGVSYLVDKQHSLNCTYFVGAGDTGDSWIYSGSFVIQLIINIKKDYKYTPAKYINF